MRKLYRFKEDFGRMGSLEGTFTAEEETVQKAMGKEVYLGELLGKHSAIYVTISSENVAEVPDVSPEFIAKFDELELSSGVNPISAYEYWVADNPEENEDDRV